MEDLIPLGENWCPHLNRCGHASDEPDACDADVYCSYRRVRFHDGPEMPVELKQEIDNIIIERRKNEG